MIETGRGVPAVLELDGLLVGVFEASVTAVPSSELTLHLAYSCV